MSTITLPRAIVETVVHDLKQAYINHPLVPELRAALATCTDMSIKCTHPENVYRKGEKVYALGDVIDAERNRIEQNRLRSEALSNKTDWAAS